MSKQRIFVRFRRDRDLWEVDYRHDSGLRRRPLFQTEERAHEYAAELLKTFGQEVRAVADREIRLRDYATQWLAIAEHEKEPKTIRTYVERLNNHVLQSVPRLEARGRPREEQRQAGEGCALRHALRRRG